MTPRQKINGVNLGNWLVLEKWMKPDLFEAFEVDDEISLHRSLEQEQLESHLKAHRDSYITLLAMRWPNPLNRKAWIQAVLRLT